MKQKLYIGSTIDSSIGCGSILTFTEEEVISIEKVDEWGWTLITKGNGVDGCVYDLTDLQVIEGDFTLRDPKPTDSKG